MARLLGKRGFRIRRIGWCNDTFVIHLEHPDGGRTKRRCYAADLARFVDGHQLDWPEVSR